MPPVRFKPKISWSQMKHSTTELLQKLEISITCILFEIIYWKYKYISCKNVFGCRKIALLGLQIAVRSILFKHVIIVHVNRLHWHCKQQSQLTAAESFADTFPPKNKASCGHYRKKTCLWGLANTKGADQPAHPHRLISAFVIHLLERIISKLAPG